MAKSKGLEPYAKLIGIFTFPRKASHLTSILSIYIYQLKAVYKMEEGIVIETNTFLHVYFL